MLLLVGELVELLLDRLAHLQLKLDELPLLGRRDGVRLGGVLDAPVDAAAEPEGQAQ